LFILSLPLSCRFVAQASVPLSRPFVAQASVPLPRSFVAQASVPLCCRPLAINKPNATSSANSFCEFDHHRLLRLAWLNEFAIEFTARHLHSTFIAVLGSSPLYIIVVLGFLPLFCPFALQLVSSPTFVQFFAFRSPTCFFGGVCSAPALIIFIGLFYTDGKRYNFFMRASNSDTCDVPRASCRQRLHFTFLPVTIAVFGVLVGRQHG
jgi:hypothetical protein